MKSELTKHDFDQHAGDQEQEEHAGEDEHAGGGYRPYAVIEIDDPLAPYAVAQTFVEMYCSHEGQRTLHYYRDEWHRWNQTHYQVVDDDDMRGLMYKFLSRCSQGTTLVSPDRAMVGNVADALKAVCNLSNTLEPPVWLGVDGEPATEIIACKNGLLHLPTRVLQAHTPALFNHNAVEFEYNALAPRPERWIQFLQELWLGDQESQETLEEILGYCLTGDTHFQKMFLLVGPRRGGKGTIARALTGLSGERNVISPPLLQLTQEMGLEPLIGKRVAIVPDARIGPGANHSALTERLLAISGEDSLSFNRKYKRYWNGRLPVRIVIFSNELPAIRDASGTLVSRFIVLRMVHSWYGREDLFLYERLKNELPGIFNRAVDGWRRLNACGRFLQPRSAQGLLDEFEDLMAPIKAFAEECLVEGRHLYCLREAAYNLYREWCGDNGFAVQNIANFGRSLHALYPHLETRRPRDGSGPRGRTYEGIGLRAR